MHLRPSLMGFVLLVLAVLLAGCTTAPTSPPTSSYPAPSGLPPAPGTPGSPPAGGSSASGGLVKEYDVTQEAAWEIAKTVFRWEGAGPIQEERKKGYMLTSMGGNVLSQGTVMGAWIEPGKQPLSSKVTILSKRRFLSSDTTLTEASFHKRFAQALAMVKQGKVLPKVAPLMPV